MSKVFVGMSGGVDSSVAALLLKEQGHSVIGIYMKNWSQDLPGMKCPWADDLADAKRVAVRLGIPFEVWDFEAAYRERVVEYMLAEFRAGHTPNPDIMCNQEVKFKLFYERALARGADYIATGHYARVIDGQLARALDENKDQTYFLYRISDEALRHTIFPIGEMQKPDVKKLAAAHGLHNAYKKESMGVCFVGEVGMKDFLKEYIDILPGEIREAETDRVLGYHEGAIFYTIGQRHGLYLSGERGTVNDGLPYYIVAKDLAKNLLYVSKNLNHASLWTRELQLRDVVWRTQEYSARGLAEVTTENESTKPVTTGLSDPSRGRTYSERAVLTRLRHRAPLIPATLDTATSVGVTFAGATFNTATSAGATFAGATLRFSQEVKRPASGQSAVLYDGEICLGGGIIA